MRTDNLIEHFAKEGDDIRVNVQLQEARHGQKHRYRHGGKEGDGLNVSVDLSFFPRPDCPMEGKIERSDHKNRDGNHFVKEGMIINTILGLWSKASRGPGTHKDPNA